MRSRCKKTWRTKTARSLIESQNAQSIDVAVERVVAVWRKEALAKYGETGLAAPPYDPVPLAGILGITDIRSAELDVDGQIRREDGCMLIEYDQHSNSRARSRFTIAHEVGHMILWNVLGRVHKASRQQSNGSSEIETLCNKLAAEILAPRTEVEYLLEKLRQPPRKSLCHAVMGIAKEFRVSLQFAALRLREQRRSIGFMLFDDSLKMPDWQVGVRDKQSLIGALPSRGGEESCGTGEYLSSRRNGCISAKFQWQRLGRKILAVVAEG